MPAQAAALAVRARIRASQATAAADPDLLYQGRDAADAALRLATRHQLAWHELDALRAHAALDRADDTDRSWPAKAGDRHARLVTGPGPGAAGPRGAAGRCGSGRRGREGGELIAGSWTSGQIVTLAVDALTPLTVARLGVFFARSSRRIEQIQWANQTVVTRAADHAAADDAYRCHDRANPPGDGRSSGISSPRDSPMASISPAAVIPAAGSDETPGRGRRVR